MQDPALLQIPCGRIIFAFGIDAQMICKDWYRDVPLIKDVTHLPCCACGNATGSWTERSYSDNSFSGVCL